uniref:Uncharacterized protein n=1 Tax=Arundo donax TaxID=35708 RepID=A0A0A9DF92_ARUDO
MCFCRRFVEAVSGQQAELDAAQAGAVANNVVMAWIASTRPAMAAPVAHAMRQTPDPRVAQRSIRRLRRTLRRCRSRWFLRPTKLRCTPWNPAAGAGNGLGIWSNRRKASKAQSQCGAASGGACGISARRSEMGPYSARARRSARRRERQSIDAWCVLRR